MSDPNRIFPIPGHKRLCLLKPLINRPNIQVGDFTYYDDPDSPLAFVQKCVLYHTEFMGDRLVIGRFTAIAAGVKFVMNAANHVMGGISTYPFEYIYPKWAVASGAGAAYRTQSRGDMRIGNDVWIGTEAMILPGVTIGDGAIVGARSVVSRDVPPYAIVTGNRARITRMRFSDVDIARLLRIAWWNWDVDQIRRNLDLIRGGDIDALERAVPVPRSEATARAETND